MIRNSEQALRDMQELAFEVKNKLFIPKRFRKAPFTDEIRENYVEYLKKQIKYLKKRLKEKGDASISQ